MYIPKINLMEDEAEKVEFMRRFSFGTIITSKDNIPVATHLPFVTELRDDKVVILSHFARANNHWAQIEGHINLVIFAEPHSYISPQHYDSAVNVPTWNYLSVHAYGKGKIISEPRAVKEILEKTIDFYEKAYKDQWEKLPREYINKLSNEIVAFEIEVTELQGKKKLSQNKSAGEKERIIESLSTSHETAKNLIAEYMRND